MITFNNFVAISIVVVCVLAPLLLLGFILHSALAEKPTENPDDKKKDAP